MTDAISKRERDDIEVSAVRCFVRPFARWHDRYQEYYREGLGRACERRGIPFEVESMSRLRRPLSALRRFQNAGYLLNLPGIGPSLERVVEAAGRALEGPVRMPSPVFDTGTGQYFLSRGDAQWRVCIDSMDYPTLSSPELAASSDVYFKTNWWPSMSYPANVRPFVNGDPSILQVIPGLRSARSTPKDYDLCFVVRVWGGRHGIERIEHNLRLLEAVNRARCRAFLLAVLIVGDLKGCARRLAAGGIPSTTKAVDSDELWRLTARSRLNVLRLGMHDCIPWRMAGSLAVGSCVVLDQAPRSQWPSPLLPDVNFLDLDVLPGDDGLASDEAYAAVPEKIEQWLAEPEQIERVARTNGEYFDRHVDPERVGEQILRTVPPG